VTTFRVCPVPADYLGGIRARGIDDFGNAIVARQAQGGEPLRCCLRDAEAGEQIALMAYQPSSIGGAYAEVGPIFIHAEACRGWTGKGYPEGVRHRQQLLRAYDATGSQVDNLIVEPGQAETGINTLLADPDVSFVHSRNVLAGCWMFAVAREAAG
jgi:hypothetical protein